MVVVRSCLTKRSTQPPAVVLKGVKMTAESEARLAAAMQRTHLNKTRGSPQTAHTPGFEIMRTSLLIRAMAHLGIVR